MNAPEIRLLARREEYEDVVRLEKAVWGVADIEVVSARLQEVVHHIGGQVFGAYVDGGMAGFCLAFPGIQPDGRSYLHSDMLAVLPGYRNRGIGRALKLAQRDDAMARGIRLMEWTFDPLQPKNAYFNLERLGAVARRYVPDYYGPIQDEIQGALHNDRFVAEWWLDSPWVDATLAGRKPPLMDCRRICLPNAISELRYDDLPRAEAVQSQLRGQMLECLGQGFTVVGFERGPQQGSYLLGEWRCS